MMLHRNRSEDSSSENLTKRLFEEVNAKSDRTKQSSNLCCFGCQGYRWTVICLLALAMIIIHAQRINVSVSLLAVYDNIHDKVGTEQAKNNLPHTSWTAVQIGILHSGFFAGYLVTQIPAAIASYQLSPHRALAACVILSCGLNLLLPILIEKSLYSLVLIVRISQGMAEGLLWPAAYVLINNWSPKQELCRISGFIASGSYAGAIIGFPLCGLITHLAGWQYNYYGSGALGLVWAIFWLIFAYDKPDHHPKITEQETALLKKDKSRGYISWRTIPWKNIISSKPIIAMCVCAFAKGWVFNLMLMQEPTYIHVFGLSIAQNGLWSALPFFFKLIVCYLSGFMADFLVNRLFVSRTKVRKIFNTLGFGIESACLFSLSFIYNAEAAIAVLTTGISMGGLTVSGWQTNHLDLAPQFAGILVALTQTYSNVAGIVSPLVAGYFIQKSGDLGMAINQSTSQVADKDIYGWHMIFLICSLIVAICCTVYIIFASGEEEMWAKLMETDESLHNIQSPSGRVVIPVSYQTLRQEDGTEKTRQDHLSEKLYDNELVCGDT